MQSPAVMPRTGQNTYEHRSRRPSEPATWRPRSFFVEGLDGGSPRGCDRLAPDLHGRCQLARIGRQILVQELEPPDLLVRREPRVDAIDFLLEQGDDLGSSDQHGFGD